MIWIKIYWYIPIFICFIIALIDRYPKRTFGYKLNNRDIFIEITVGNIFKQNGTLIIGANTTFDTDISKRLISEKSIQGQFTKKMYFGDIRQLDKEITAELLSYGIQPEVLPEKRIGKDKKYPIGTTVKLTPQNKTFYLVAIANMNEHGTASANFDYLKQALASLWVFIGRKGLKEDIVIPVVGSGFSRLTESREEIIREIIKSFIAACSESTFCDKLTIVLSPSDVERYKIDIDELEKYLIHICKYTSFSNNYDKIGTPI